MKHEAFDLYEGVNMFSSDRITMREKGEVGRWWWDCTEHCTSLHIILFSYE